ncbi:hypothetical protein PNA2_1306 [Pyrococcus sp. NA2]|uniref:collagen-binding protein n=1 Tax=Pyrococcus sp. (strain NA2) TaxID=342949 RepID=UPI000209AD6A|nr:collagen-binding protein [Pyrococcus sp. NA2]AEC52221.1 hypothetical protein PNA2_1306 [Pyrococcus sp. NA2]
MRRFGFVLALIVLLASMGTVRADIVSYEVNFTGMVEGTEFSGTVPSGWSSAGQYFRAYHYAGTFRDVTLTVSNDDLTDMTKLEISTGGGYWQYIVVEYNQTIPYFPGAQIKVNVGASGNNYGVGVLVITKSGNKYATIHFYGKDDGHNDNLNAKYPDVTNVVYEDFPVGGGEFTFNPVEDLQKSGIAISEQDVAFIRFFVETVVETHYNAKTTFTLGYLRVLSPSGIVTFNIKDALSGQPLSEVTVKEGDTVLGTVDDGGSLELTRGTHTLTFEKPGYWSVTKTVDVQGDMSVSVEMYPDTAAFEFENFPSEIKIPENTIYELTFTLSPITTQATYNTYLSISGLQDILEVKKDGQVVSPESGKYYLGDISEDTQVSIKFKAGSIGTHAFTITITSNDAIASKTYSATKQVTYKVEPLPFSVQMPSEWQVGVNELRISESSGRSYIITAILKDSKGNEVWSDSHAFGPYEAYSFQVNVPGEGEYVLELQFQGKTAVYDITVNPAITLKTKTLTVQKGGEGTIVLHFKNPSNSVQYYTIKVSGGFLPTEINQSISVAPLAEKDVSIAFAVPNNLTYDAYELQVQVLQGDNVVFQDKIAVTITDSGGFSLLGGGDSNWLLYGIVGLLIIAILIALARR